MKDDHALTTTARLDEMFLDQAALTPDAAAILFRGRTVSYGELEQSVQALSHQLSRHGVGPGVLVAISLQRTPAMIAVLLAILKAGGAYLPLDARYPPERTRFVLSDSGAAVLITDGATAAGGAFAGAILELSDGRLVQRADRSTPLACAPAELAYVIYTSGSTGAPKGVMLGHGAIHLVDWARGAFSACERSRIAATTSLCFDPSIFEIFVPLCTGGALILKENGLEPFAADERPTLLDSVPSILTELCRAKAIPDSVKVLNVGGEPLPAGLAREAYRGRPALTLYNHYGPTEATTCVTVARVPRDLVGEPSIGRPVRGARIVLLDDSGQPVGEGETGEIHIGGPGLALGYINQPGLTAARFSSASGARLYRTGDLGLWRDGELHFAGRTDQQVKVRGFRVELGEVEAALLKIAQVDKAVVVVRESNGRSELVGYVQAQQPLTAAQAREVLAGWLPDYMIPARIVVMAAFPLLVSGKVDVAALPQPTHEPQAAAADISRMEWPIVQVFEEVLGRSGVGPDQSFFDLGGDSLSSVRAGLRLGEILGYELPPALIHQSPTPRALAESLQHARTFADRHISLLQPGGSGSPLFCTADLFGQAFNYLSLARRLAPDRPTFGVVPGPLQAAFARDGDVAALTRSFVAELRRQRPEGPYLIAGHSAGGVLALDLACALQREGESVALILLDATLQSRRPSARAIGRWALQQGSQVLGRRKPAARRPGAPIMLGKLLRQLAPGAPPSWVPRSQFAFAASMIKAGALYRPSEFFGPTLMIRAVDRDPIDRLFDEDGYMGWSAALKGVVVQEPVQGAHFTFLREPVVSQTALAVRRFLLAHG